MLTESPILLTNKKVSKIMMSMKSLPIKNDLLLLKAALLNDNRAVESWNSWVAATNIDNIDQASFRLFPLVYQNLINLELPQNEVLIKLKNACRYHWAHTKYIFGSAKTLFEDLIKHDISMLLLKGAPLALKYYNNVVERPMSDIDLMVPPEQIAATMEILHQKGFKLTSPLNEDTFLWFHAVSFKNEKGLQLDLHASLYWISINVEAQNRFWERSVPLQFEGLDLSTLSSTDHLYHTFIHGLNYNTVNPMRWVSDAFMILNKSTIDWSLIVENAKCDHQNLRVLIALSFLSKHFIPSLPIEVFKELENNINWSKEKKFLKVMNNQMIGFRDHLHFYWNQYKHLKGQNSVTRSSYIRMKYKNFKSKKETHKHKFISYVRKRIYFWSNKVKNK